MPDEAKDIIERWRGADGKICLSRFRRECNGQGVLYDNFKKISAAVGFDVIYYSARKSFAQHALELGIDTRVIDYLLGHSINKGGTSLYHYIYVTPQMATEALQKVLQNLK